MKTFLADITVGVNSLVHLRFMLQLIHFFITFVVVIIFGVFCN